MLRANSPRTHPARIDPAPPPSRISTMPLPRRRTRGLGAWRTPQGSGARTPRQNRTTDHSTAVSQTPTSNAGDGRCETHGIRNPRGSDRVPSKRMVMPAVGTAHCQDSAEIPVPQAPPRRMDKPVVLNEAKARPLRTARVAWPLARVSRSPLEGRRRPACSAGRLPHTRGSARDARRGGRTRRQRRHRLLHRLRSLRA